MINPQMKGIPIRDASKLVVILYFAPYYCIRYKHVNSQMDGIINNKNRVMLIKPMDMPRA